MKTNRALFALLAVNLIALGLQFVHASAAPREPVAPIVRARALELVDDDGRVRAELKVMAAAPNARLPDGTIGYPETVLLRLLTSKNGPNVKLETTEDGSGLVLGGEKGYVQILSRGNREPFIKIVTKDGREKVISP